MRGRRPFFVLPVSQNQSTRKNLYRALAIGIGVLVFDLITKALFFDSARGKLTREIVGIVSMHQAWAVVVSVSVAAVFGWWAYHVYRSGRNAHCVMLVFSGALGNLFDRIMFGGVRDWIPLFSFSIITIADIAIGIGIAGLVWSEVIAPKKSAAI